MSKLQIGAQTWWRWQLLRDTVAAAVVGPLGHVLVGVLLILPWDQVVQRLEHVLVTDVMEPP